MLDIKTLKRILKLSQNGLARDLGMSKSTLYSWLNREKELKVTDSERIKKVLSEKYSIEIKEIQPRQEFSSFGLSKHSQK